MRFERNIHSVCADLAPRKFEFVRHYTMPCAHWSKHRACVRVKKLRMRNEEEKKKKNQAGISTRAFPLECPSNKIP